jgi:D-sedoheptulose 7-phosphate isomerase
MIEEIRKNFADAQRVLDEFINNPETWVKFEAAGEIMANALKAGNTIYSCGNGGSMCDAMHFAEELSGRYRLDRPAMRAIAISDASHMSCVGNDFGYDYVFSRYLEGMGRQGDVLLAISTSGNSKNIIKAAEAAKAKGIKVIALTGKNGGQLAPLANIELRAPQSAYADRVQEIHIKIIHSLIHYIEMSFGHKS